MMRSAVLLVASAATLSSCANGLPGLRPATYQQPGDTMLVVSYANCPDTPAVGHNFAPALAAIAMSAVSTLLDNFGNALEKGAAGGDLPKSTAMANIELNDAQTPACIFVIRGHFTPMPGEQSYSILPPYPVGHDPRPRLQGEPEPGNWLSVKAPDGTLEPATLPDVYGLQHFAELQILQSKNGSALTFVPVRVLINQSMDGSAKGDRSMSIELRFQQPGKEPIGSAVALSGLQVGKPFAATLIPTHHFLHESPWFGAIQEAAPAAAGGDGAAPAAPEPNASVQAQGERGSRTHLGKAPSAASKKVVPAAAGDTKSDEKPAPKPVPPYPFTVTATIVETRPTREYLAFVASVFSSAKPSLEAELKKAIGVDAQPAQK